MVEGFAPLIAPLQNGVFSGSACGMGVGVPHYVSVVFPFSRSFGWRMQGFLSPCLWFRVAHLSRTQSRDSWEIKGRYCLLLLKT